jgi:hypothetical protein
MIKGNDSIPNTCKDGSKDIWGKDRPRDIHLQLSISFALGIGAFLTFCVRPHSLVLPLTY